jgi:hypothetical protein
MECIPVRFMRLVALQFPKRAPHSQNEPSTLLSGATYSIFRGRMGERAFMTFSHEIKQTEPNREHAKPKHGSAACPPSPHATTLSSGTNAIAQPAHTSQEHRLEVIPTLHFTACKHLYVTGPLYRNASADELENCNCFCCSNGLTDASRCSITEVPRPPTHFMSLARRPPWTDG